MINRRQLVQTSAAAIVGAGLAACGGSTAASSTKRPFVLVHGAWLGAWSFERLSPQLAANGHAVVARDLPAHGLKARLPASYSSFPRPAAFHTELSPSAGVTLDDYVSQVVATVDILLSAGLPAPVLVGHSMAGLVIQAAAEKLGPEKLHHLVYIAAFMPANNKAALFYIQGATQADAKLTPLFQSDPTATAALRLDFNSLDPAYQAELVASFYADVDATTALAIRNLQTPDAPVAPFATPIPVTPLRWGKVPRTYLRTAQDFNLRPASQDLMISQADDFTPENRTRVVRLDASHSPFLSQPEKVAEALLAVA